MSIHIRVVGLVASAIVASAANAQTAVEWKISSGGNSHWYLFVSDMASDWNASSRAANNLGGHLATISSPTENAFVFNHLNSISAWSPYGQRGPFLGGYQNKTAPDFSEPAGGWRWVTGEPWASSNWSDFGNGEPNNDSGGSGPEDVLTMDNRYNVCFWNDAAVNGYGGGGNTPAYRCASGYLVEWDADCNGDGMVDYGQIIRGELEDLNANGVPDICETSITSVLPPSVPSQGGTTITIRGNGFPASPIVLVGGVPATNVVRESLNRITATSPAVLPGMKSVSVNGFTLPDGIYIRPECGSDLDQNGTVDAGDISIILLDFGPCYESPSTFAAPAPTPLLLPDATSPAPTQPAPQSARPAPQPRGTAS
jgi:hypothetical protein